MNVAYQPSRAIRRRDFEFSDLDSTNEEGDYCVGGRLRNPGNQLPSYLVMVSVLYDDQGDIINFDSCEAPAPEEVVGDAMFDFEVCVDTLTQNVARYELRAWGQ